MRMRGRVTSGGFPGASSRAARPRSRHTSLLARLDCLDSPAVRFARRGLLGAKFAPMAQTESGRGSRRIPAGGVPVLQGKVVGKRRWWLTSFAHAAAALRP